MKNTRSHISRRYHRGLTLVEIVVVISLLGLLMTVIGRGLFSTMDSAKVQLTEAAILELEKQLQIHKAQKSKYPSSLSELAGDEVYTDGWDNEFSYSTSSSCGTDYEIISLGRDGKKGGSDLDADISSCNVEKK